MSESELDFQSLEGRSRSVFTKESGARNRKEVMRVDPEPEEADSSAELSEYGQKLQKRVEDLISLYKEIQGLDPKKLISEDLIDYSFARLDPSSSEYIQAHLVELDSLATRVVSEHRLLPMVEKAIGTWEQLAGHRPTDYVQDGLRLDNYVLISLKDQIEGFLAQLSVPGQADKANNILTTLRKKYPSLMEKIEGIPSFKVEDT